MGKIVSLNNINKTIRYLKKNGISEAYYAARERIELKKNDEYVYSSPDKSEFEEQRQILENTTNAEKWPFITVVIPAYETKEDYLRAAIDSVVTQSYLNWELIIVDASKSDAVKTVVKDYVHDTIRYIELNSNKGISENTNVGLDLAQGDYIALLDHDDVLATDALFEMAKCIKDRIQSGFEAPAIVYSDEDKTDENGEIFFDPHFKFDFNFDLYLTNNYICHLMLVNREKLGNIRLRAAYDGAQDYDLVLQIITNLIVDNHIQVTRLNEHIIHVQKVLYHWRCHLESTAANTDSKMYAYEAGKNAVEHFIDSMLSAKYYQMTGNTGAANLDTGAANSDTRNTHDDIKTTHSKHLGFYKTTWGRSILDIYSIRPEIGAVITRKLDNKGKMTPVILGKNAEWMYVGLDKHFSGELNRFDSAQDVFAADIRFMNMREEVKDLYISFLNEKGITEKQILDTISHGYRAESKSITKSDGKVLYIKDLSIEFAKCMHEAGYMILFYPKNEYRYQQYK